MGPPWGLVQRLIIDIMMGVYFVWVHPCNKETFFSFGAAQRDFRPKLDSEGVDQQT